MAARGTAAPGMMQVGHVVISDGSARRAVSMLRRRLVVVAFLFACAHLIIGVRLVHLGMLGYREQTHSAADEKESAASFEDKLQFDESPTLVLPRRDVTDRNGVVVATSLQTRSLYADPKEIKNPKQVAQRLQKVLPGINVTTLEQRLKRKTRFVWIKRNLTPKEQYSANMLGIPGLYFEQEHARVYPQGPLMAHVLGFVGRDNDGLAGIEKFYDSDLRKTGIAQQSLPLSIDLRLQYLLYNQLTAAMEEFRAIGAAGTILDVKTGEVLAYVSLPSFDLNHPGSASADQRFNRLSLGTYEMGSTFKTFAAAMALQSGTVTMEGGYDVTNPIRIGGFTITDTHPVKRWLSLPEIYAYSSNIGAVHLARDVGIARQQDFLTKLGMFSALPLEIPERATPRRPTPWNEINLMTISFGHGISVTPMHLVNGIAAVINGGQVERMTLLKDRKGALYADRVLSEENSRHVRRLMRAVVQYGTASKANVLGYEVGGKTGTAEKVKVGGYNTKAQISSFIGAFPMSDPRYVILTMLDEPKGNKSTYGFSTGGWVAAPTVGRIIAQMGPLLGLAPNLSEQPDAIDRYFAEIKAEQH